MQPAHCLALPPPRGCCQITLRQKKVWFNRQEKCISASKRRGKEGERYGKSLKPYSGHRRKAMAAAMEELIGRWNPHSMRASPPLSEWSFFPEHFCALYLWSIWKNFYQEVHILTEKPGKLSETLDPGFCEAERSIRRNAGETGEVGELLPRWRKDTMSELRWNALAWENSLSNLNFLAALSPFEALESLRQSATMFVWIITQPQRRTS